MVGPGGVEPRIIRKDDAFLIFNKEEVQPPNV